MGSSYYIFFLNIMGTSHFFVYKYKGGKSLMALFRISKGNEENLPKLKREGFAYFTVDENDFYINADYYYIKEEELEKEVKRNDVIREI